MPLTAGSAPNVQAPIISGRLRLRLDENPDFVWLHE
jgi:hypothetical protein